MEKSQRSHKDNGGVSPGSSPGGPFKGGVPMEPKYTHKVIKDGKMLFGGTADECFEFILDHQGHSVQYALEHGGYKIVPRLID